MSADWPHVYREGAEPVLLTLHGTGGDEHQIIGLAERIAPGATILAPRGRVSEGGANRWFRRLAEGVFDVDDVIARAAELAEFVSWASTEYGLDGRPVIATGFSNGANMALALGMLHPEVTTSVIAFSGMYPFGDRSPSLELASSRLLVLNGESDPMAPSHSVDTLVARASEAGAEVTRMVRPGGHGITEEELSSAADWI